MVSDDPSDEIPTSPNRLWERTGLAAVILVAAGLRLFKLEQNGTGNPYYGAAVRSMLVGWNNFFFGSFDPAGVVTVDKPPVALWIQTLGAKLLGYGGPGVLLPQALMGVASVALTYHLVRRAFGAGAGMLAGLALAITPICVAIDRDNLPDTALVLALLLATWALARSVESGRLRPLLLAMALVGLAFNIKMLAAFVVLPTFVLAYWLASPVAWPKRLAYLAASGAVLAASSLSWAIAVELTPKDQRPYIGGSRNNSALELALGYNGLARIMGMGGFGPGGPPGGMPPSPGTADSRKADPAPKEEADPTEEAARKVASRKAATKTAGDDASFPPFPPGGPGMGPPGGPGGRGGMPGFGGTPGFARFVNRGMAGLITWLFPLAILGGAVAATRSRPARPIGREHFALAVWGGWFATHWFVFSFAQGIFHEYYTTVMGPSVAALAGIGAIALWDESRKWGWRSVLLPGVILMTAAWQGAIVAHYPDWKLWLLPTLIGGAGVGSATLLASGWLSKLGPPVPWGRLGAWVGLAALFVCPAAWSLAPVLVEGNSMIPSADPTMLGARRDQPLPMMPFGPGRGGPFESDPEGTRKLVAFLVANRHDESILVAALGSMPIAPIIIETGEPAVALGGFMGADPAISKTRFVEMVGKGQLRFFLVSPGPGGGGGPPGGPGRGPRGMPPGFGGANNAEIVAWVRENGKLVDPELWKHEKLEEGPAPAPGDEPTDPARMFGRMRGMTQLYDCRPELGLAEASAP